MQCVVVQYVLRSQCWRSASCVQCAQRAVWDAPAVRRDMVVGGVCGGVVCSHSHTHTTTTTTNTTTATAAAAATAEGRSMRREPYATTTKRAEVFRKFRTKDVSTRLELALTSLEFEKATHIIKVGGSANHLMRNGQLALTRCVRRGAWWAGWAGWAGCGVCGWRGGRE